MRFPVLLLAFLLAGGSTLSNGIHVDELPANGASFEVLAGYRVGVRDETSGTSGLAATTAAFLQATPAVRTMAAAAYGAGGDLEFFSDLDRTGFRLKLPAWARPMVDEQLAAFFSETPAKNPNLVDRALADAQSGKLNDDFRSRVEDEIRLALLGTHPYDHRPAGWKQDLERLSRKDIEQFFSENYGTDRGFVVITGSAPRALADVQSRASRQVKPGVNTALKAERSLRFQPELADGAVILGSPVPSIYYRGWYSVLLLDRLIQRTIPGKPQTSIVPALDPYYYRIEVPVPAGKFADAVQATLFQDIDRMQYVRATERDLDAARQSAIEYLESEFVKNWFLSFGIPERRQEGIDWIRAFSADEMRVAARDLLISNRAIASWDPKAKQVTIQEESLGPTSAAPPLAAQPAVVPALAAVALPPFPSHSDPAFSEQAPELLPSGVSVVASSAYAIFVAPDSLKIFNEEPGPDVIRSYAVYRPNRILVMAPAVTIMRVKQQWASFQGNARDFTQPEIQGKVTSGDLPVLLVLKMILDRRLIESGLWPDVQLNIRPADGSTLAIHASDANRRTVLNWIKEIAEKAPSDVDVEWAREAAIHRMDAIRPELQSLMWQWDPQAVIGNVKTILAVLIQDVAKRYDFQ